MGHGNQFQAPVVNAENFVPLKIELLGIAANLFIIGRIAKAQITVRWLQQQQVLRDALAVGGAQGTDGNHNRGLDRRGIVRSRPPPGSVQQVLARIPRSFQPVFGIDHGVQYKGYPE